MKKIFIVLAICLFLVPAINANAGDLIRAVIVMYDETHYDPVSQAYCPESLSGAQVNVIVFAQIGVNFTQVKAIQNPGPDQKEYWLTRLNCEDDYNAYGAGEAWILIFKFWPHAAGQWKFKVWSGQNTEIRTVNAANFCFPPKPTNISWQDQGENIYIEWDASVGPPEWKGSQWKSIYRVVAQGDDQGCSCAYREMWPVLDPNYDLIRNRVWVTIPSYLKGCWIRIENNLRCGGYYKYWQTADPYGIDFQGQISRSQVRMIIPYQMAPPP